MTFPIKPPLYAIDPHQINDLLMVSNVHINIGVWLKKIKHFPINQSPFNLTFPGIMLFERFSPWVDSWAEDYTTKLYNFYFTLAASESYNQPYFNGFGLLNNDYGNELNNYPAYDFNIPDVITLSNNLDQYTIVTYLQRNYDESDISMGYGRDYLDFFSKRRLIIPPFSTVEFKTERVLFCSMVVSGVDNQSPSSIGIPQELDYAYMDFFLNELIAIVIEQYPYLNRCIKSIDYELTCVSEITYDATNNLIELNDGYGFNWVDGTLTFDIIPDWYYEISLIYANNDLWGTGEQLKVDLGLALNIIVYADSLGYDFLHLPDRNPRTSSWIKKEIVPNGFPRVDVPLVDEVEFMYRDGIGTHEASFSNARDPDFPQHETFISQGDRYGFENAFLDSPTHNGSTIITFYHNQAGYTNTGIGESISPSLFASVSGIVSGFNSLLLGETLLLTDISETVQRYDLTIHQGVSRFFFDVTYDLTLNNYEFTLDVEEKSELQTINGTTTNNWYNQFILFPNFFGSLMARVRRLYTQDPLNGIFLPSNQVVNANYVYSNKLSFTLHSQDPKVIRNNTDQEIIDFINNIIFVNSEDVEFMPDSQRIIEIHEALNAGKFANDPDDPEIRRFANLGYYIERIARVLGISVDPDGSIRSVRQRAYVDSGDTIPAGWPVGQWGRNQGASTDGQQGGKIEDDRDGVTYPVVSNKFALDPFTGEPTEIREGGYALCENLIQYLETFKDDLDKALGLQYAGANSFPLVNGQGDVSYEGLSILVQENAYMLSQLSKMISSAQISSLVTQAITTELLAHCGVPTTVKELEVTVGENEKVYIPYPAITGNSPSQFDQTLWLLSNLSPLLGGKINIRQDQQPEETE